MEKIISKSYVTAHTTNIVTQHITVNNYIYITGIAIVQLVLYCIRI